MVLMFEIAGPFRWKPKTEKAGPMRRWIWAWFSVAYIAAGFNDVSKAIRQDERERMSSNVEHNRRTAASSPGVRVDGPVGPHRTGEKYGD